MTSSVAAQRLAPYALLPPVAVAASSAPKQAPADVSIGRLETMGGALARFRNPSKPNEFWSVLFPTAALLGGPFVGVEFAPHVGLAATCVAIGASIAALPSVARWIAAWHGARTAIGNVDVGTLLEVYERADAHDRAILGAMAVRLEPALRALKLTPPRQLQAVSAIANAHRKTSTESASAADVVVGALFDGNLAVNRNIKFEAARLVYGLERASPDMRQRLATLIRRTLASTDVLDETSMNPWLARQLNAALDGGRYRLPGSDEPLTPRMKVAIAELNLALAKRAGEPNAQHTIDGPFAELAPLAERVAAHFEAQGYRVALYATEPHRDNTSAHMVSVAVYEDGVKPPYWMHPSAWAGRRAGG